MKKLLVSILLLSLVGCSQPIVNDVPIGVSDKKTTIRSLLKDKTKKDKINTKSIEIAKFNHKGKFKSNDNNLGAVGDIIEVEIDSLTAMEGGIQIYARAWLNDEQLGFGEDGSVDLERFLIYNPPILVSDIDGDIIEEIYLEEEDRTIIRVLSENPVQAVKESLLSIINTVGKKDTNIVLGSVGNTTSTFFSGGGDGFISAGFNASWDTIHDASVGGASDTLGALGNDGARYKGSSGGYVIYRGFIPIDTSGLPDGDTISSVTFHLWGNSGLAHDNDGNDFITIVQTDQPSTSALTTSDWNNCGATDNPTEAIDNGDRWDISDGIGALPAYIEFPFNSTGIGWISKTGFSMIGSRGGHDVLDHPVVATDGLTYLSFGTSERNGAGTTEDPKLVIVHAGAGGAVATPVAEVILFGDTF